MSALYPIGCVLPYSGPLNSTAEAALIAAGYLPCDGRALGLTDPQYKALFQVIGTSYGATATTFCVPDYRGLFLRGTDNSANVDPEAALRTAPQPTLAKPGNTGDTVGSMQPGAVVAHTHGYATAGDDFHYINYGGLEDPGVFAENGTSSEQSGTTGGLESRPRNIGVNYVITFV
jgi:microcystin-dependent protein